MTKSQLHNMAVLADEIYNKLSKLDSCPLIELSYTVDKIRGMACILAVALDEYDEHTGHDFGEGIKLED